MMSSQHRGVVGGRHPWGTHTHLSTLQALYQPPYSPNGEPSFCFPWKTKTNQNQNQLKLSQKWTLFQPNVGDGAVAVATPHSANPT